MTSLCLQSCRVKGHEATHALLDAIERAGDTAAGSPEAYTEAASRQATFVLTGHVEKL